MLKFILSHLIVTGVFVTVIDAPQRTADTAHSHRELTHVTGGPAPGWRLAWVLPASLADNHGTQVARTAEWSTAARTATEYCLQLIYSVSSLFIIQAAP